MLKDGKLFDIILFLNEFDLLEVRLDTLYEIVDYFIITEINETFSGVKKPLLFEASKERYRKYSDKIIYNPIGNKELLELNKSPYSKYKSDFNKSIYYQNGGKEYKYCNSSLTREVNHRDSQIIGFLNFITPEDYILLSDLDEIPNPIVIEKAIKDYDDRIIYFKMEWYLYWINNRVSESWFGTVLTKFKNLENASLSNLRYASSNEKGVPGKIAENGGWHFSYLGGLQSIMKKLKSHPYQGRRVQIALLLHRLKIRRFEKVIKRNEDIFFLNRKFEIIDVKKNFPKFLLNNYEIISKYMI